MMPIFAVMLAVGLYGYSTEYQHLLRMFLFYDFNIKVIIDQQSEEYDKHLENNKSIDEKTKCGLPVK